MTASSKFALLRNGDQADIWLGKCGGQKRAKGNNAFGRMTLLDSNLRGENWGEIGSGSCMPCVAQGRTKRSERDYGRAAEAHLAR